MGPADCEAEILRSDGSLKLRVKDVLEKNGCYILFYYKPCNGLQEKRRIKAFKKGIATVDQSLATNADIQVYGADKIVAWVNTQISTIMQVKLFLNSSLPHGLRRWEDWNLEKNNQNEYVKNPILEDYIKTIKNSAKPRSCCRITGLSGLGKTRLALEAFRPDNSKPDDIQLSNSVVYFDFSFITNEIVSEIISWQQRELEGILVADNCPLQVHKQMQEVIEHSNSKLSLISIDYNPEKDSGLCPYIELNPQTNSEKVIKGILQNSFPGLRDPDISRVIEFAQGFPKMAVLLAHSTLRAEPDIGTLKDADLIHKLLWGRRNPDKAANDVISACSLFERFGFNEDLKQQRNFIAKDICHLNDIDFYSYCQSFIEHGIIDIGNRYARVIPPPLAIHLAAEWWQKFPPERFLEFIETIPEEMKEAFWDQTKHLHFVPRARELVEQFVGVDYPFGQAEVLNTEMGSRLFRSFVEVNPESTSEAIYRAFASKSREELLTVGPGRRNLVWALEKLCYWKSTFPKSWQTLLKFASAESETWSNNSTGIFLQLFHIYLSGTEVPCSERLNFVRSVLETADDFETKVLLNALGEGLKYGQFMRAAGVERQGSRAALKDWKPKDGPEITEYWKGCIELLIKFARKSVETENIIQNKISENISSLVQFGLLKYLGKAIRSDIAANGKPWNKLKNSFENYLSYREESLPEPTVVEIRSLMNDISSKDLIGRAKDIVSMPEWIHRKTGENQYVFVAEENAKKFAQEISKDKNAINTILPYLLSGEQRQASVFGNEIYLCLGFSLSFASDCMNILSTTQNPNASLLGGYLSPAEKDHPWLYPRKLGQLRREFSELYSH
jgi:hypothetical protein